jgi:hypothetical protein
MIPNEDTEPLMTTSEAIEKVRGAITSDNTVKIRDKVMLDQEEREELASWLRIKGREEWPCPLWFSQETKAEKYEIFLRCNRAAELLLQKPEPTMIPVSERPILKSNPFNDELGRCWCGTKEFVDNCGDTPPASWEFREPDPQDDCFLPANAIPQPQTLK